MIQLKIKQTLIFERSVKKLNKQNKAELDIAVKELINNPYLGDSKKGDLSGIRVYKFKMNKQLTLLAYSIDEGELILYLIKLGSHENFYRDLKSKN